MALSQSTLHCI